MRLLRSILAPLALCLLVGFGCGSEPGPRCDPARCNAGNICVQNQCMLPCARHVDCPNAYECREIEGQAVCAKSALESEWGEGLFGSGCAYLGDEECAADRGFVCIGRVGDPDAYCSKSPCTTDADCPGNYWCQTVERANGPQKACIRRSFCAPADSVTECNDADATFGRDEQGNGWCLKSCSGADPNSCGGGNGCLKTGDSWQCWPRSRTCTPSKSFCGRCTSRLDCPAGALCLTEQYTKERYCTQPCTEGQACPATQDGVAAKCVDGGQYGWQCVPLPLRDGDPQRCWKPCPESGCK